MVETSEHTPPHVRCTLFTPTLPKLKRVAAYARVSTTTAEQLRSLAAQVQYFYDLISATPGWEFAGLYSDTAISGRTTNRPQLQQLLAACERGEIDIVLTKSISRFSRNIADCLHMLQTFKTLGVVVVFEKERLRTDSVESELLVTLMAAFAEEESRSISENTRKGIEMRIRQGTYRRKPRMYGYRVVDGTYKIHPEQAAVVREMFEKYLSGWSYYGIAKYVNKQGHKTIHAKDFTKTGVKIVLNNRAYTGVLVFRQWSKNPLVFPKRHPAIISEEMFQKVQKAISQRRSRG